MSKENWRKCRDIGLTGPETPTCLAAALDLISKRTSVSQDTYQAYTEAYEEQFIMGCSARRVRKIFGRLLEDLTGSSRVKNVSFRRATSFEETEQVLNNAKQGGKRVCIAVEDGHVVGVRPVRNGWKIEGHTWLDTDKVYNAEEIDRLLWKERGSEYRGKAKSNIYLFPSELRNPNKQ